MALIFMAFYTWAIFALCVFALIIGKYEEAAWKELALSLVWPILIPMGMIYFSYNVCVKSVKHVRQDLKNRGVLQEFDKWYDENKSEKDL